MNALGLSSCVWLVMQTVQPSAAPPSTATPPPSTATPQPAAPSAPVATPPAASDATSTELPASPPEPQQPHVSSPGDPTASPATPPPNPPATSSPPADTKPVGEIDETPIPFAPKVVAPERIDYAQQRDPAFKPGFGPVPEQEPIRYGEVRRGNGSTPSTSVEASRSPFLQPKEPGEPQRFAIEFKFGPFRPDIDKNYKGPGDGPYRQIFGKTDATGKVIGPPPLRLLSIVGFEWQFLKLAGPLAVATSIGLYRDSANSLIAEPTDPKKLRSKADETTFSTVPITLQLSYRFEWAADRFHVPLVPYAKGGFLYGVWWSKDGNGNLARSKQGEKARGGSPGWQVDGGIMLRMTDFDRHTAKKLNTFTGINHLNFFAEYRFSQTGQIGSKKKPNVGGATWMAGLAIEF